MPAAKRSAAISPARLVFLSALVILVALVVWVAVRAVGPSRAEARQPVVVVPSASSALALLAPPPPLSASPSAVSSPSASPSVSRSSPAARRSSSPSPSSSHRSPAPPAVLTATVTVTSSWDGGYVAMVQVFNKGPKAVSWSVAVSHSGLAGLRLGGVWNAQGRQSGSTFFFGGGLLGPGQGTSFGYQAGKQGPGAARPSGCSVSDGSCHVS